MPYIIRKRKGKRPYKIINKITGRVVGSSTSWAKAMRSIGYRMASHRRKRRT